LPIDYRILGTATLRLLSNKEPHFSPSSKKNIIKKLLVLSSMDTIEKMSSPFSCTHPSCAFDLKLYFISPNEDVSLASPDAGTVRFYPHASCYAESSDFCLVVADFSGVIDILHDSLKAATTLGQQFCIKQGADICKKSNHLLSSRNFCGINKTSTGPSLSSFWSRRTEAAVTPFSISFSSPRYK
jgi:hypothetical protein